jgi:GDP-L-fucose synthase
MTGEPSRDLYTYAMTKRMLLQGLKALNEQFGMKFQYFVPSTLYGPDFEENDNHFIFDLIKKITSAKRTGEPPILWGNGFQIRELIFVEDAVELILRYSMSPKNGIINLASGLGATIRDYAQKISLLVGYDSDSIIYDPDARYVGTMRRVLDVTQLKTDEPDFDWTPLDNGLRSTIDYYYKSYGSN